MVWAIHRKLKWKHWTAFCQWSTRSNWCRQTTLECSNSNSGQSASWPPRPTCKTRPSGRVDSHSATMNIKTIRQPTRSRSNWSTKTRTIKWSQASLSTMRTPWSSRSKSSLKWSSSQCTIKPTTSMGSTRRPGRAHPTVAKASRGQWWMRSWIHKAINSVSVPTIRGLRRDESCCLSMALRRTSPMAIQPTAQGPFLIMQIQMLKATIASLTFKMQLI